MASDNWKREAWVRFAASPAARDQVDERGAEVSAVGVARYADYMLALMEQREREGWFGAPQEDDIDGLLTKTALTNERYRADRAEAEAERLKAELVEVEKTHHEMLDAKERHARKVESLLKEALRGLRRSREALGPASIVSDGIDGFLERARQEGFNDGE